MQFQTNDAETARLTKVANDERIIKGTTTVAVVDFGKYRRMSERYGTVFTAVYDWPIPPTNAPDREPVISATEPVHQGQGERGGMSASRRGARWMPLLSVARPPECR